MHTHTRKKELSAASNSVRAASAGSSPRAQVKKDNSALRYAAYDTPPSTSAQRSKPKRQESFNSLESYTSASHKGSTLSVVKDNWHALSPDIVDLAQGVAGGSSRSISSVVRRQVRSSFLLVAHQAPNMTESRDPFVRSHRRKDHIRI